MDNTSYGNRKINDGFFVFIFFIIFVVSVISNPVNKIALYILIPCLFVYSFLQNPRLILNFKPLFYFFVYILWSIITTIKSVNFKSSLSEIWLLLSIFVFSYIIVEFSTRNIKYVYIFYWLYVLKFWTLMYKGYTLGFSLNSEERFSDEMLNANLFGYLGFFAVVSSFFIWKVKLYPNKKSKNIHFWIFSICTLGSVTASFIAASRAGIILTVFAFSLFLVFNYLYPFSKKTIANVIVLSTIIFLLTPFVLNVYSGSTMETRFQIENIDEESRFKLIVEALNVGLENPFFGVGSGNFIFYEPTQHYSHSTYFEVFANNGFLGLGLFLYLLYYYWKKNKILFKLVRNDNKRTAWYFLIFLVTFGIYNFFYVFHTSLFLMSFFFLVSIHLHLFTRYKFQKIIDESNLSNRHIGHIDKNN